MVFINLVIFAILINHKYFLSFLPDVAPPVAIHWVGTNIVSFGLAPIVFPFRYKFLINYTSDTHSGSMETRDCSTVEIVGLKPGTEYSFSITRIAEKEEIATLSVVTGMFELEMSWDTVKN